MLVTLGEGVVLGKAGDALFVILTFVDAELRLSLLFVEVVEHLVLARAEPAVERLVLGLADLTSVGDGAQGLDDGRHLGQTLASRVRPQRLIELDMGHGRHLAFDQGGVALVLLRHVFDAKGDVLGHAARLVSVDHALIHGELVGVGDQLRGVLAVALDEALRDEHLSVSAFEAAGHPAHDGDGSFALGRRHVLAHLLDDAFVDTLLEPDVGEDRDVLHELLPLATRTLALGGEDIRVGRCPVGELWVHIITQFACDRGRAAIFD